MEICWPFFSILQTASSSHPPYPSLFSLLYISLTPYTIIYSFSMFIIFLQWPGCKVSTPPFVHQLYPKCLLQRRQRLITSEIKTVSLQDLIGNPAYYRGQEVSLKKWSWTHKRLCVFLSKGIEQGNFLKWEKAWPHSCKTQHRQWTHDEAGIKGLTVQGWGDTLKKFEICSKNNGKLSKGFKGTKQSCPSLLLRKTAQDTESGLGEWDKSDCGGVASGRILLSPDKRRGYLGAGSGNRHRQVSELKDQKRANNI